MSSTPLPAIKGPPAGVPKRKPVANLEKTIEPQTATATAATRSGGGGGGRQWWNIQENWALFSTKKKRILVGVLVATTVCLLALIIGLAVGLTKRHGKGSSNLPLPTSNGGPYQGDLTYYDPGLGSCGITSTDSDMICAVSHVLFDAASTSSNPNNNPLCGLKLRIKRGDKSVDVKIVDRCPGCKVDDLDVSPAVFQELAELAEGRVVVDWSWLEKSSVSMD
ncbi:hypothetical protein ARAM_001003 [Aspergillus rambellii]|uniref:RlpA-like protein double-psi beta-barrel domain-containing protein n=1 Tax=Aspergillus rambellii TaxID=308745 RepID=A0A0F8XSJ8_9EURO|nr:hypothetical protein ARAM_001003 [Aspergillus rambellii]